MFGWFKTAFGKVLKGVKSPKARAAAEQSFKIVLALTDRSKPYAKVISMATAGTPISLDDVAWRAIQNAADKHGANIQSVVNIEDRDRKKIEIERIVTDAIITGLEKEAEDGKLNLGGLKLKMPADVRWMIPRSMIENGLKLAYNLIEQPVNVETK